MRTNTPRLWFLSASLPMLILNLSFVEQSAYATTEADTIQHQPNKTVQKSHSMSVYNRTTSAPQDTPLKTTKPHSLIQKRVKPEAQEERAPLGSQADKTVPPLQRTPSPSPFVSPSASSLNTQAVPHAAIPFTSTLAPTTPTQSPTLIQANNVPAPSAKSVGMEAAAALHTLRAAASTLSGDSSNVSDPPTPRRRLQFEMPTLTQSFKPARAEQPPAIGASPLSFSFTAQEGGSAPTPQILSIQNTGDGVLTWTTSDNAPWLILSLASGINSGTVLLSVDPGTLTVGTYVDTITISAADSAPIAIPITFTITAPPVTPAIGATPLSVTLTAQEKSSTAASQSVTISNTGGGTLTWTASETAAWLSLSPASGTDTGTITVTATAGSLTPGTYNAAVNLSAPGATAKTIPVSFTITAAPVIGATPLSVTLTAQEKSSTAASQSVMISNTGGGTLTWTASETAAWLSLSPASGTGTGTITVAATAGSLTPGTYSTSVNVSAPGATTVAIPVSLTVTAAPVPPAIGATPLNVILTAQQNSSTTVTQSISVSNTGGGTLTWTASETAAWLSLSPASGTDTGTVTVTATAGSLTPGTYNASVNLSAPGATAKAIPVSFTITAAPAIGATPLSVTLTAQQNSNTAVSQFVTLSNTGGGTLTWTANETAAWLSLSPASGTGTGTIKVTATAGTLTPGTYTTSVNVSAPGATAKAIPVSFTITQAPTIGVGPVSVTLTAQQNSTTAATQSITISNTGGGTLTWTASETETWLSLSPASGTGNGTLTLSATAGSLTPGTYNTSVSVSAPGATAKAISVAFTVTLPTTQSATLTWTANGESDLAGYKIYRATATGAYGAPITTLGKTTSYTATGLSAGTTYFFVITAYDSVGNESPYSNEVSKSIY